MQHNNAGVPVFEAAVHRDPGTQRLTPQIPLNVVVAFLIQGEKVSVLWCV